MNKNQSTGDKFKVWCEKNGRPLPPDILVTALNSSIDEGTEVAKAYVTNYPEVYKAFRSFLTRSN